MSIEDIAEQLTWNAEGLIPVIVQDAISRQVLMMAWMNREALRLTVQTRQAVYWSRSRQMLWHKGLTSGHIQNIQNIYLDCDADTLLLMVEPVQAACHTGAYSCFFYKLIDSNQKDNQNQCTLFWAEEKGSAPHQDTQACFDQLMATIVARKYADPNRSYIADLFHKGDTAILKKIGEEATEVVLAAKELSLCQHSLMRQNQTALIYEIADLWFHLFVVLARYDLSIEPIVNELMRRVGVSGLVEKKLRIKK